MIQFHKTTHVQCDKCGGIIGDRGSNNFECDKCGKRFDLCSLDYDFIAVNNKTGWMFPVKKGEPV